MNAAFASGTFQSANSGNENAPQGHSKSKAIGKDGKMRPICADTYCRSAKSLIPANPLLFCTTLCLLLLIRADGSGQQCLAWSKSLEAVQGSYKTKYVAVYATNRFQTECGLVTVSFTNLLECLVTLAQSLNPQKLSLARLQH